MFLTSNFKLLASNPKSEMNFVSLTVNVRPGRYDCIVGFEVAVAKG